ncbi:lipocalin family protein [Aquimarina sp. AU58]|uniref:lipocalin family protein n=1 Tax=Aquimarina sp. AU58 TaxID=1874112 RepID=UPI000D6E6A67|nr:lipocalin family protein [Aquimarina sp. AU58]
MKKLNLLILVFATIFISCSKDDDTSNEKTSDLIGTWELIHEQQSNLPENTLSDCEKTSTIEFKSDKTYIEKTFAIANGNCVSDGEYNGSWSESGDQLTLQYTDEGESITDISKFGIANNELTLIYNDEGILITYIYKKR